MNKEIDGNKMATTKQPIMSSLQKKIESKNNKEIDTNMTPKQIGDLPDELGSLIQDFIRPTAIDMERFRRKNILFNKRTEFSWYGTPYYYSNIIKQIEDYLFDELIDPETYENEESIEYQFNSGYNIYNNIFTSSMSTYETKTFTLRDINAIMGFVNDMDLYTDNTNNFEDLINLVVCYMALDFSQFIFDGE